MPRKKKPVDISMPVSKVETPKMPTATQASVITPHGTVAATFTLESHGEHFTDLATEYATRKGSGYTVR